MHGRCRAYSPRQNAGRWEEGPSAVILGNRSAYVRMTVHHRLQVAFHIGAAKTLRSTTSPDTRVQASPFLLVAGTVHNPEIVLHGHTPASQPHIGNSFLLRHDTASNVCAPIARLYVCCRSATCLENCVAYSQRLESKQASVAACVELRGRSACWLKDGIRFVTHIGEALDRCFFTSG